MAKTYLPKSRLLKAGFSYTSGSEKQITVEAGDVYVDGNNILNFAGGTFNLDTVGLRPSGTNWNSVLVSLNSAGVLNGVKGTENAAKGSVVDPTAPTDELPIALVFIQGDGASSINNIITSDVKDYRPILNIGGGGAGPGGGGDGIVNDITSSDTTIAVDTTKLCNGFHYISGATTELLINGSLAIFD